MKRIRVTILETGGRRPWFVRWHGTRRDADCKSAANALKSVQRYANKLYAQGDSSIVTITWLPQSRIGRMVVNTILGKGSR